MNEIPDEGTTKPRSHEPGNTNPNMGREIDLLIFFDSNRRCLDFRRLWTINNSGRKFVGILSEIRNFVNVTDIKKLNHVFTNVEVNDIDSKNWTLIFQEIVELLIPKYPGRKIACSEITPLKDRRDAVVL